MPNCNSFFSYFNKSQFDNLLALYKEAVLCLRNLSNNYPQYRETWHLVEEKINLIKKSLDTKQLPSSEDKQVADISSLLTHEFRDSIPEKHILPLYKLDNAYTLLGVDMRSKNYSIKS